MTVHKCVICGKPYIGYGNNPAPVYNGPEQCCDECNATIVIPARMGAPIDPLLKAKAGLMEVKKAMEINDTEGKTKLGKPTRLGE